MIPKGVLEKIKVFMAQFKKIVPLKKIITNHFDKAIARKYLKGIELNPDDTHFFNPDELYQSSLKMLINGESEKAINYIIFSLDIYRNDKLILHLTKVMLFSLSKFLLENNVDFFQKKYGANLEEIEVKIRKKIKELVEIINKLIEDVKILEDFIDNNSKSLIFKLFKLKKFKRQKEGIQSNIYNYKNEIQTMKDDLTEIEKNTKVNEYVRVLCLVIEACVFPSRFEWILSQKE